jgi:hypothetical protein
MSGLKKLCREPLVHFFLIGVGLFLVFGLTRKQKPDDSTRIVVDASQVEQLVAQFSRTWMRPPTDEEIAGLIREHIRNEIYYREAVAMGLDQNDPIIRMRMRQKLEFLLEDLTLADSSSKEALTAYLREHPGKFRIETRVSFHQVYLSPDKHGDLAAVCDAVLENLQAGVAPESLGDPIMVEPEFTLASESEIARQFGEAFAREMVELEPGAWSGPVYSGLGGHVVRVTDRREGYVPELAEVRAEVEREYLAQKRQELKDAAFRKLLEGYEIVIEPPTTTEVTEDRTTESTRPARGGP